MAWEEQVLALFEDLEQQASGLHLADRDTEVDELAEADHGRVLLTDRVRASLDRPVRVGLLGGRVIVGRLRRLGADWVLVDDGSREWLMWLDAVSEIAGLESRALPPPEETSVLDRLTARTVLRRLAAAGEECVVVLTDDRQVEGRLSRVGRDFVEVRSEQGSLSVVRLGAVAALAGRS